MSEITRLATHDLLARDITFRTGGNPRVTHGFKPTGWMPNLPGYLRKHGIHPHDHFKVHRCIATRIRGGMTINLYECERDGHFVYLLGESIHAAGTVEYVHYQVDAADYDQTAMAQLLDANP